MPKADKYQPADFQRGEAILLRAGDSRTWVIAEVTKVLKTGIRIQAAGFIHTEALNSANVMKPPTGTVVVREAGPIRDVVFTDKGNRMRVVGARKKK